MYAGGDAVVWGQQDTQQHDEPAQGITLNLPESLELTVLIEYVSQRLSLNILYDPQVHKKQITIKAPTLVPEASLLEVLESSLQMNGLALVDAGPPGWKRVVPAAHMAMISKPVGKPEEAGLSESESPSAIVTRVFTLEHVVAKRVQAAITPFLTQPGANAISINERGMLIVTDFQSNMQRIHRLITRIDQPLEPIVTEFIPVTHRDAADLANQAQKIFDAKLEVKLKSSLGAMRLTRRLDVTNDSHTNQVVVIGTASQVQEAARMIRSLDTSLDLQTRVYRLEVASPERIDRLARELIGPLADGRLYRSVVDEESRILVVTTTQAIHEKIGVLKADLDVLISEAQSPIRVYKLTNAKAADVLDTIRSLETGNEAWPEQADQPADHRGYMADRQAGAQTGDPGVSPSALSNDESANPAAAGSQVSGSSPTADRVGSGNGRIGGGPGDAGRGEILGTPAGGLAGQATVTVDINTNSVIVIASPQVQQVYENLISLLDRRRPQVLIEVTIVSINTSDDFSLGVEIIGKGTAGGTRILSFSQFGISEFNPATEALSFVSGVGSPALGFPDLGFNGAVLDTGAADVVINALKRDSRVKVVSAPRILVNDNATGTLSSIAEEPTTSVNASDTVATTSFSGFVEAGTTISVTPHISEGDHLNLEYSISLNSFVGTGEEGIPPPRQTDSIESEVTVPNGRTIIVGGLNRTDRSNDVDAVPVLGEIPVLKHLFSNETENASDTTLFVFLRPIILRDDQFEDLKFLSETQLSAAGLPGDFPVSEPLVIEPSIGP